MQEREREREIDRSIDRSIHRLKRQTFDVESELGIPASYSLRDLGLMLLRKNVKKGAPACTDQE